MDKNKLKDKTKDTDQTKQTQAKKQEIAPKHLSKAYDPTKVSHVKPPEKDHSTLHKITMIAVWAMIIFTLLSFVLTAVAAVFQN